MTDARLIEWNAVLDGIDTIRPSDSETDVDYYFYRRRSDLSDTRARLHSVPQMPRREHRP